MVMVIWGANFVVAKIGVTHMPPLMLIGIRFLLLGLILVPFVPFPKGKMWQIAALSVVLGTLHFGLMFTGWTPGSRRSRSSFRCPSPRSSPPPS